jgi:hypothetical protein
MIGLIAIAALALEATQNERVEGVTAQERLTRSILDRYAKCLVTLDGPTIRSMLLGDPKSRWFDRWRKSLNALCMLENRDDSFYLNPDNVTLRFALADVIVRDLKGGPVVPDLAAVPPLTHPERPAGENGGSQAFYAFTSRLGECLVRRDPGGASALLKTGIATEEERVAIGALLTSARTCMTLPASGLKIDTTSFRGAVALNYLRLAKAANQTARVNSKVAK